MNAIVTVIGKDRIKLAGLNINVLDISQTIMQGNFTMIMAVDVSQATASFAEIRDALADLGKEMELSIRIQREEIFNAMHSI